MYYIGVDLGGTNVKIGIVNKDGKILRNISIKTKKDVTPQLFIKDISNSIKKLISDFGISTKNIGHIGIGVPGLCDNEAGVVLKAVNINFLNVNLREEMKKYFDIPVYLENDANCAALAEAKFGVSKGYKNSITITLGTGIGGGIIIDNKIYKGFNCASAELGHMSIDIKGNLCNCGRRGCFETYASATALKYQAINVVKNNKDTIIYNMVNGDINKIEARLVFNCAKKNDKVAVQIVDKYMSYLSCGIENLINILQPDIIAIGGGISNAGEYFLEKIRGLIKNSHEMAKDLDKRTKIELAKLGNDAGIIGAAFLG